jgi:predicted nucleotidyltransferase
MEIGRLQRFFAGQRKVRLAYLFGSYGKGTEGPLSDIDIAVFLNINLSKHERQETQLALLSEVSSILKTDGLDLVVMNDCPVELNYEIIKHGKILNVKDEGERVDVESMILSRYLDRRYYEQRGLNTFLERVIQKGGL